jgi:hypothetical protein
MPDSSTTDICPTQSVFDSPSPTDSFRHNIVAEAIVALLLNERGGRGIALHGKWGSGKSTVVGMVTRALQDSRAKVFTFDTWAHQGDPLRRTFLEQLIEEGLAWGWLKQRDHWHDRKERLARRKETIDTATSPRLTGWGVAGAISLLIAAPAAALYNKVHYEWHKVLSVGAFFIVCSPLCIGLAILCWWWLWTDRSGPLPNLIFSSTQTSVQSTSIKTPDPTSLEFEQLYCEILAEMLVDTTRQVVFVIDNLDRMSKEDAQAIWSTMRTFFDGSAPRTASWHDRLWMLVPFDPDAIREIFPDFHQRKEVPDSAIDIDFPRYYDDTAEHFLEKTFQITFNVPPIIVSNWEHYLISLLETAFPKHAEEEFHQIFRVFDRKRGQEKPPTPRQLKVFVNAVGSVHRIWQDRIPLVQQAAYTLLFTRNDFLPSLAMGEDNTALMGRNLLATVGADWQRNFAAMYFNVEVDAALETLLREPIQRALRQADEKAIRSLSESPGFREVLERVLEFSTDGNVADPTLIANSARALVGLDHTHRNFPMAWQSLRLTAPLISQWVGFDTEMAEGILAIEKSGSRSSYISATTASLMNSLQLAQDARPKNDSAWLRGMFVLLRDSSARERLLKSGFQVPGSAEEYISVIATASAMTSSDSIVHFLKPAIDASKITEALVVRVHQGNWDREYRSAFRLMKSAVALDSTFLASAMATRVRDFPQATPSDCAYLILSLFDLGMHNGPGREYLMNLVNDQNLYQRYESLFAETKDAAAAATLALLSGDVDITQQVHGGGAWQHNLRNSGHRYLMNLAASPDSDPKLLETLATTAMTWQTAQDWLNVATQHSNRKAFIARIMLEAAHIVPEAFSPKTLLGSLDKWRELLSDKGLSFVLEFHSEYGSLIDSLKTQPIMNGQEWLYLLALRKNRTPEFVQFLRLGLEGYGEGEWVNAFEDQSALLQLANEVSGDGFFLGSAFQDAALLFVEEMATSETEIDETKSGFISLLNDNDRLAFGNSLTNLFKEKRGKLVDALPSALLKLVESQILADGLEKHAEPIKQIIENGSDKALLWLRRLLEAWNIASSTQKAVRANFKSRAEKRFENDAARSDALNDLLSVLRK